MGRTVLDARKTHGWVGENDADGGERFEISDVGRGENGRKTPGKTAGGQRRLEKTVQNGPAADSSVGART